MSKRFAIATLAVLFAISADAFADDPDPWIARDKAFHFDVSAGIAAVGYGVSAAWLVDSRWKALALGGGLALVAGAGKEMVDASGVLGGDASWKDLVWDAFGTVAGLVIAWSVDLLLGGTAPGSAGARAGSIRPVSMMLRF